MEHLGVDLRVIEAALNHVSSTKAGIVGIYQRAEHREAVRAAFVAWDTCIAGLTGQQRPSNVVSLSPSIALHPCVQRTPAINREEFMMSV